VIADPEENLRSGNRRGRDRFRLEQRSGSRSAQRPLMPTWQDRGTRRPDDVPRNGRHTDRRNKQFTVTTTAATKPYNTVGMARCRESWVLVASNGGGMAGRNAARLLGHLMPCVGGQLEDVEQVEHRQAQGPRAPQPMVGTSVWCQPGAGRRNGLKGPHDEHRHVVCVPGPHGPARPWCRGPQCGPGRAGAGASLTAGGRSAR